MLWSPYLPVIDDVGLEGLPNSSRLKSLPKAVKVCRTWVAEKIQITKHKRASSNLHIRRLRSIRAFTSSSRKSIKTFPGEFRVVCVTCYQIWLILWQEFRECTIMLTEGATGP